MGEGGSVEGGIGNVECGMKAGEHRRGGDRGLGERETGDLETWREGDWGKRKMGVAKDDVKD